ncbi:MAG TPA: GYF domain-containing protein [Kofleriaceae bacterium]|nr:GYF domain-containing protein [Kofleriaceae bacterium]
MKFLCDKCKTRYSIGDERVRGKILKIRCKNCANVITVREGMAEPDADAGARRNRSTSAQQAISATAAIEKVSLAPQGALGAAFASQMTKPPPALEEEWYVSMDGNQEGPFSLPDAQRWVTGKPFDAELHCWSEGFDDWLPVDKVSHFRNLRKRPVVRPATIPPPIPKVHQPLFAATMASIEKAAAAPEKAAPPIPSTPAFKGAGAPLAAKANGTGSQLPSLRGTGPGPAMPGQKPVSAGAAALAAAFGSDLGESHTTVDSPVFNDEIATTAEPHAAKRIEAKASKPMMSPAVPVADSFQKPGVKPIMDDGGDDDDNLEIGEVSRVVKLTDIAAMGRSKSTSNPAMRVGNATASNAALRPSASNIGRATGMTGAMTKLSPSELGMNVDPSLAALSPAGGPAPDESIVARSFASRHRRGLIVLIAVSAVMVLGVIAAVIFVVSGGNDDLPMGLGGTRVIDTSRPEDIVRRQLPPPPNAGSAATTVPAHKKTTSRPGQSITTGPDEPETGPGSHLDASEVEAMAAKYNEGTKRCYMRAQKGALGFEIAETKKIDVTITVGKDGSISDVKLSKHANNEFGQCLISRIKGWKFRESKGGTFQFALAFSAV